MNRVPGSISDCPRLLRARRCRLFVSPSPPLSLSLLFLLAGCATTSPNAPAPADPQEAHRQEFGSFDLPHKVGVIENIGLQLPVFSPDGQQVLYLRADQAPISPLTLLGSNEVQDTPPDGYLTVWLRPAAGNVPGRRVSRDRWSHSPAWSPSGRAVCFVTHEPAGTSIVWVDLASGTQEKLGVTGAVNCLPRFADDRTLLFCSGASPGGPFRICRQRPGEAPVPLTPAGVDFVHPAWLVDDRTVIAVQAEASGLSLAQATASGSELLASQVGDSARPALLSLWAGVAQPVSPGKAGILFYDALQNRICVYHVKDRIVRRHRPGSVAACWLDDEAAAIATPEALFVVDTASGVSQSLLTGPWIPAGYVRSEHRLLLLGREGAGGRFNITTIDFKPGGAAAADAQPSAPRGAPASANKVPAPPAQEKRR